MHLGGAGRVQLHDARVQPADELYDGQQYRRDEQRPAAGRDDGTVDGAADQERSR
jgi:hypothetical protein